MLRKQDFELNIPDWNDIKNLKQPKSQIGEDILDIEEEIDDRGAYLKLLDEFYEPEKEKDEQHPEYFEKIWKLWSVRSFLFFSGCKEKVTFENFEEMQTKENRIATTIIIREDMEDLNKCLAFLNVKKSYIKKLVLDGYKDDDIEKKITPIFSCFARHLKKLYDYYRFCYEQKKINSTKVAQFLKEEENYRYIKDDAMFYKFDNYNREWKEIREKEEILRVLLFYDEDIKTTTTFVDVYTKMKGIACENKRELPLNLIPLKNGIYDIAAGQFRTYERDDLVLNKQKLKCEYNEDATCPEIDKFFSEIVETEKEKELLYEFVAYSMYRDNPIAKAFLLVGTGANGKSTYLELLNRFFGYDKIASYTLQNLEQNRFMIANLKNKYLNIFGDLPYSVIKSLGFFKALTSGDYITAEKKFSQYPVEFKPTTKLIFSSNKLPRILDDSDAVFRRLIIIKFPKVFLGEMADPDKIKKITTPEELSGLFNEAIKRLPKILKKGFSYNLGIEEIRTEYENNSNSILYFINECVEPSEQEEIIIKEDLFIKYVKFCESKKIMKQTSSMFFRSFPEQLLRKGFRITTKKIPIEKKVRKNAFVGNFVINIEPNEEETSSKPISYEGTNLFDERFQEDQEELENKKEDDMC